MRSKLKKKSNFFVCWKNSFFFFTFGFFFLTCNEFFWIGFFVLGWFCFFCADPEKRVYKEMDKIEFVQSTLEDYLDEYNNLMPKAMHLVLFRDAIGHLTRLWF